MEVWHATGWNRIWLEVRPPTGDGGLELRPPTWGERLLIGDETHLNGGERPLWLEGGYPQLEFLLAGGIFVLSGVITILDYIKNKLQLLFTMLVQYVATASMLLKCHIYANYFICRFQTTMWYSIYSSYQLTTIKMSPQALVYIHITLLAFVPEQICLSHHTSKLRCPNNVFHMETQHYFTWKWKKNKTNKTAPFIYHIYANSKYASQMPYT